MKQRLFGLKSVHFLYIVFLMAVLMILISIFSIYDSFMELIRIKDHQELPKENSVLVIQQYPSKQEVFKNNLLIIIKSALK